MGGRLSRRLLSFIFVLTMLLAYGERVAHVAVAQQAVVAAPYQRVNDSFYENFGVGWHFQRGSFFFNQGGPGGAVPPFGGFDPNSGASFGIGGNGWGFNFNAGAGSTRSIVSETPYLTLPNGGTGFISDMSIRPFVTGVIPVVGGAPNGFRNPVFGMGPVVPAGAYGPARPMTPLEERLARLRAGEGASTPTRAAVQDAGADIASAGSGLDATNANGATNGGERSPEVDAGRSSVVDSAALSDADYPRATGGRASVSTAEQSDISVTEIRRLQQLEDQQLAEEAANLVERGRQAEAAGKRSTARIYYEQAARLATGDYRTQLLAKIAELRGASKSP